jgi:hypothetical protein
MNLTPGQIADVHSRTQAIIDAALGFEAMVKGMAEPVPDPQREAFEKWWIALISDGGPDWQKIDREEALKVWQAASKAARS